MAMLVLRADFQFVTLCSLTVMLMLVASWFYLLLLSTA